ncbi:MAG: hypothetical protein OQK76_00270 [Gammaproteobacteria bacterium]|nr:hypothetical protein [Gammaproteobacteria bacterium]MCW8909031.1 hypothetical protein [Gammaproteobacteria bacterium]MCW9005619.1 hypothetical protein [Gammaproteobacteria bacterium]MCW9056893.1 hypothetical protein [Gammaproteobacteria bacterium]
MLHPGIYLTAVITLFTLFYLTGCSDKPGSAEQQIRQFITLGEQSAEQRKMSVLKELVSDNYRDERNLDRKGILRLAQAYFMGHQNIHLFTHIKDIHITKPDQAHVTVFAAMTGTAVDSMDAFISLRARLYLFELSLSKEDDEWKLNQARWRRAQINEMLNEP